MFDLRYHVASLAAVFLMLVVGILIGVGISGRGFVDNAERDRFNDKIAGLEERADTAKATAANFERRQRAAEDFVESAYPVLVGRRLAGKKIAVAVLGSVEQGSFRFVESAITEDAGGRLVRMRAVMLPLRLEAIEAALADRPELGATTATCAASRSRSTRRWRCCRACRPIVCSSPSRASSRTPMCAACVMRT